MTKICYHCHETKELSEFNKCKTGMQGFHNHCRNCQKIVKREWYLKNRESQLAKAAEAGKTPITKARRMARYQANREKLLEQNRFFRKTESARAKARAQRTRWLFNPHNRISCTLRCAIRTALKTGKASSNIVEILGCSVREFVLHIESLFKPGMSWENYAYTGWQVDHKIPCSAFNLTLKEDRLKCFNFKNLQPLWWKENLSKGKTYDSPD